MGGCRRVADMLGAYVYGDLTPEEMRTVRLHVNECDECAGELEIRTRVIKLIPNELPKLADDERQRITWAVKGAVRARSKPKRFFLFSPVFARCVAVAAVVGGAFACGTIFGVRSESAKVAKMSPVKPAPASTRRTEENRVANSETPAQDTPSIPYTGTMADPFSRTGGDLGSCGSGVPRTGGAEEAPQTPTNSELPPIPWQNGFAGDGTGGSTWSSPIVPNVNTSDSPPDNPEGAAPNTGSSTEVETQPKQ